MWISGSFPVMFFFGLAYLSLYANNDSSVAHIKQLFQRKYNVHFTGGAFTWAHHRWAIHLDTSVFSQFLVHSTYFGL
ncbi:hypothetical protein KC19_5G018500 [Ceratodon purpureus]|uniref:Uncharacterized protein n=1 Tax=Ceratodon purpureus TaxID=3225 RepID=A0A8T0HZ66_CERPU|nr:hypothetical protein KC19_5G018500 [Ceratodon purpureus]